MPSSFRQLTVHLGSALRKTNGTGFGRIQGDARGLDPASDTSCFCFSSSVTFHGSNVAVMNNTAMTPDQDTAVAKLLSRHSNLSLKEAIQVLQESGWNFNGALALLDLKERREQDEEQKLPATNKEGKSTRNKVQGSKGMELKKDAAATKGRQAPDEPLDPGKYAMWPVQRTYPSSCSFSRHVQSQSLLHLH